MITLRGRRAGQREFEPAPQDEGLPPHGRRPDITATGLTRTFGDVTAVDQVDLEVPAGSVFGLLGPDGAGKTTLIRMLATVLPPDSGEAVVAGASAVRDRGTVTARIGYMAQRFSMYPDLTVAENLEFFATVRGVRAGQRRERSARLLEAMGLAQFAGRESRFLSGGMKQKLMLAATLMHEPQVLLLDEPTTGVDPLSRREFWQILADLHVQGSTILVATPYMDEAERCTDIAFLDGGRVQHRGTPAEITALVPGVLLEVLTPTPRAVQTALAPRSTVPEPTVARDAGSARAFGAETPVRSAHLYGDVVRVLWDAPRTDSEHARSALDRLLRDLGVETHSVRVAPVDMEAAFASLADRPASAGAP